MGAWTSVDVVGRAGTVDGVCIFRGSRGHSLLVAPTLLIEPASFFHSFLFFAIFFI